MVYAAACYSHFTGATYYDTVSFFLRNDINEFSVIRRNIVFSVSAFYFVYFKGSLEQNDSGKGQHFDDWKGQLGQW